jgi:hypothetical protein
MRPKISFFVFTSLTTTSHVNMDRQLEEDRKMVPRLKISSISPKENIYSTYLISINSLPEDEQTFEHGGGGRYNAI